MALERATDAASRRRERRRRRIARRKRTSAYNKRYYEGHAVEIAVCRRTRYWSDPELRQRLRAASRRWISNTRRTLTRPQPYRGVLSHMAIRDPGDTPELQRLFRTGDIAAALGWSRELVRGWIRRGVIPPPTFRTPELGWPLYTEAQVLLIGRAAAVIPIIPGMRNRVLVERFRDTLQRQWVA